MPARTSQITGVVQLITGSLGSFPAGKLGRERRRDLARRPHRLNRFPEFRTRRRRGGAADGTRNAVRIKRSPHQYKLFAALVDFNVSENSCLDFPKYPGKNPDTPGSSRQMRVEGNAHQLHGAARAKLLFQLGAIVGDGFVGNVQRVGDFGHGLARCDQAQNLQFARAEAA